MSPPIICWAAPTSGGNMRWAAGRRPRGSLLPQGACPAGCTPHFLFRLAEKKTGRARSKRKGRLDALRCSGPPRDGGRRIGACSDFACPSGTLGFSAISGTAVPWRMVLLRRGGRRTASAPLFAAAGRPARELVQRADEGIRPYGDTAGPARRGRPVCRLLQERQPQRRSRCPHPPESINPYDHPGSA